MRAAFWVGCAALLLSACSSEPVQQATAAHVAPGLKASMSSSGEANCAMIGGSLSVARQLDGTATVSYTHLDVYKRQAYRSSLRCRTLRHNYVRNRKNRNLQISVRQMPDGSMTGFLKIQCCLPEYCIPIDRSQ